VKVNGTNPSLTFGEGIPSGEGNPLRGCNLDIKKGLEGKTIKPSSPEVAMPSFKCDNQQLSRCVCPYISLLSYLLMRIGLV
jgi:hypothetical protein